MHLLLNGRSKSAKGEREKERERKREKESVANGPSQTLSFSSLIREMATGRLDLVDPGRSESLSMDTSSGRWKTILL